MKVFNLHKFKQKRKTLRNNSTKAEKLLWERLKQSQLLNLKFRRQQGIGRYVVDFYCPEIELVIELDGESHDNVDSIEYDKIRTEFFEEHKIIVLRYKNEEVFKDIEKVLADIKSKVNLHFKE
ncbi:MAG: endonuclease domain-containing protein [Bacteroidetes bacterium]|nr:endonuclease domain-containing protein [Bacteroidota bacterium]